MKRIVSAISVIALLFSGCGYHFRSRGINIKDTSHFTRVIVQNLTYEPEIEMILNEHLIKEFAASGWISGGDVSAGGSVFLCTVAKFENNAVSYTSADDISHYEVVAYLDFSVYKDSPGNALFSISGKRYSEQYIVSDDIKITQLNKKNAIKKMSEKFSSDVKDTISEGF